MVTVVLGRFDPLVGPGLAGILCADRRLHIVASGLTGAGLHEILARAAPCVVVLDEAADPLRRIRGIAPATRILLLAHDPSLEDGMRALACGASCVAWNACAADLLAAVHLVARGDRLFMAADGRRFERRYPDNAPDLTPRETDVLRHLSQGKSHAETARDLRIGVRTVHTYAARVCRKLGVSSKQELIGMPIPDEPHDNG
jgi:two-component system invasion response regulator UvrY